MLLNSSSEGIENLKENILVGAGKNIQVRLYEKYYRGCFGRASRRFSDFPTDS